MVKHPKLTPKEGLGVFLFVAILSLEDIGSHEHNETSNFLVNGH